MLSDESGKITLRYLTLGPFGSKRRSIEIPVKDFLNYQIITSMYGYKKDIILFRHTPKGTAKYPPVSISAFNKQEIMEVEKMLKKQINLNTKR